MKVPSPSLVDWMKRDMAAVHVHDCEGELLDGLCICCMDWIGSRLLSLLSGILIWKSLRGGVVERRGLGMSRAGPAGICEGGGVDIHGSGIEEGIDTYGINGDLALAWCRI